MGLVCEAQETLEELSSSVQVTRWERSFAAPVGQTSRTQETQEEISRNQTRLMKTSRRRGTQMEPVSKVQVIQKELVSKVQETQMEQV